MKPLFVIILSICSLSCIAQNTKLKPARIYDFSGYWMSELGGGNSPWNWFDGFQSHDPKYNNMSDRDTAGFHTSILPYRNRYHAKGFDDKGSLWRGDRGIRLLLDMSGDRDMFRLTKYNITDIYGLQQSGTAYIDTIFFYNFDKVFEAPVEKRPMMCARPDSLLKPFAIMVPGHPIYYMPKWNAATGLTDSMRYIYIRIVDKDRNGYYSMPDFKELVFYGNPRFNTATIQTRPARYSGPLPKRLPAKKILGNNNYGVDTTVSQYDGLNRYYQGIGEFDRDTIAYPNNRYNFNVYYESKEQWNTLIAEKAKGKFNWTSVRGSSKRNEKITGHTAGAAMNVTYPYMEPEDPLSYQNSGDFWRHYAAKYGANRNHSPSNFRYTNVDVLPDFGYGFFNAAENGNEDESWGTSPFAYVARTMVDYDGWEGRIPNAGMKLGDPSFKLIAAAQIFMMDTQRLSCLIFLSKLYRSDRKIVWDYFNGHHYARTYNTLDHIPTYEEMVLQGGESPEKDFMYERVNSVIDFMYKEIDGDTTKKYLLTEYGYDNWSRRPQTLSEIVYGAPYYVFYSTSVTPKIPGYDSTSGKGIIMVRSESIFCATALAGYNEFAITNNYYEPNNISPGLFASCGRGGAGDGGKNITMPTKFANYWTRASFWSLIKNYIVDSVLSLDSTGLCMIKWRHESKRDSVCYELWKGTYDGSQLNNIVVDAGKISGNVVRKSISFTSPVGESAVIPVDLNRFTVNVTEKPEFYFVREIDVANLPPVAVAGSDQSVTLPVRTVFLSGKNSYDQDGNIVSYKWTRLSGPVASTIKSPANDTTTITGLVAGIYVFQLTVTDNRGAAATDDVTISVMKEHKPPKANAGPDETHAVNSNVSLIGSAIADGDAKIEKYIWTYIAGPERIFINNANSASASFRTARAGEYTLQLSATDNKGETGLDEVKIMISSTMAPVLRAHAGKDSTVIFPYNKAVLNGSASIGTTSAKFSWRQLSGPSSTLILQSNALVTNVSNLTLGTYVFELTITNSNNIADRDTVEISVVSNLRITSYYNVYPNPLVDRLTIECLNDTTGKISVSFYDIFGRKVLSRTFEKTSSFFKESMDISMLKPSMYILELLIAGESKAVTMQMIKKE